MDSKKRNAVSLVTDIHVLKAISLFFSAWEANLHNVLETVSEKLALLIYITNVGLDHDDDENFTLENEISLSRLAARMQLAPCDVTAEDFTMIDADVVATETRSADDIIPEISNIHEDDSSYDDKEEAVLPIPTLISCNKSNIKTKTETSD